MLAGVHNLEGQKVHAVKVASRDLDFSLAIKRERMMAGAGKGYHIFGRIETIYIAPDETGCQLDPIEARGVGRRLYWPDGGPYIARTIPEEDLIIPHPFYTQKGRVILPDVPDINEHAENPYKVDRHGKSLLAPGEAPHEVPKRKQRLEMIASAKFKNFLVFHPISQIILYMNPGGALQEAFWGTIGDHRMPISSLTGFDGRKMALLVDPYTGEAYFSGGRYDMASRLNLKDEPIDTAPQMPGLTAAGA